MTPWPLPRERLSDDLLSTRKDVSQMDRLTDLFALLLMAGILELPEAVRLDSDAATYAFHSLAFSVFGPQWLERVRYYP